MKEEKKYEKQMENQPPINYCPSCSSELERRESSTANAFYCTECDVLWNIQYLTLKP